MKKDELTEKQKEEIQLTNLLDELNKKHKRIYSKVQDFSKADAITTDNAIKALDKNQREINKVKNKLKKL